MDTIYVKHVRNFIIGRYLDHQIIFAIFDNLESAISMDGCDDVAKHSSYIDHHILFVKQAWMQGMFQVFKIPSEINPADVGTQFYQDKRSRITVL